MKIKKILGSTAHEAMLNLKKELGPDAVVLNTKTVRAKGILKYFKKPLIEITAAYEEKDILKSKDNKYQNDLESINKELSELKNLIKNSPEKNQKTSNLPVELEELKDIMLSNGIDLFVIEDILEKINNQVNLKDKSKDTIENIVKFNLMEYLGDPKPITLDDNQKTIFLIGPTGVGKTTTLAKIAASIVIKDKYKVGLITSDTYRIGAVDQLKIYSDILDLPLEIAYNKEDMYKAFDKFKEKDIILVDTAGRNHNNKDQVEELKNILDSKDKKEIYLLLSATTDKEVLAKITEKYSFLEDFKIIVTKVDEADNYGNIFNIKYITGKELSYCTTGQNVPDDIQIIDKDFIIKRLIKENCDNGPS